MTFDIGKTSTVKPRKKHEQNDEKISLHKGFFLM